MVTNSVTAPPEGTVEPSAAVALPREVTDRVSVMKVPVSLTTHMLQFSRLIIITETTRDPLFNPGYLLDQSYFYRVFMAFCKHCQDERATAIVDDVAGVADVIEDGTGVAEDRKVFYDKLVRRHFSTYSNAAKFGRAYYGSMARSASYAARQAVKDYENNIRNNFAQYLQLAVNKVLQIDERVKALTRRMVGHTRNEIHDACVVQIWAPARAVRAAIAVRPLCYDGLDEHGRHALDELSPILLSYEDHYEFTTSIYYDVKANPANHFLAFVRLCDFLSQHDQAIIDAGLHALAVDEAVAHADAMASGLASAEAHDQIDTDAEDQRQLAKELRDRDLDAIQAETRYRREQTAIANDEDEEAAQAAFMASIVTAIGPLTRNQRKRANRLRRRQVFNARRSHQHPNQDAPQQQHRKAYQCCPLRTSFIPGHIHIDSAILYSHFLLNVEGLTSRTNPRDLWAEVVDLKSKPFRDREGLTFHGAVDTDGVSISIILKHPKASSKEGGRQRRKKNDIPDSATDPSTPDCPYLNSLSPQQVADIQKRLVFNDMGRGDLHFMLGWDSTAADPIVLRYTRMQRLVKTRMRHYTQLREIVKAEHDKTGAIRKAELYLASFTRTTFNPDKFLDYIAARTRVWDVLRRFYSETMTTHSKSTHQIHSDPSHVACDYPFHRKLKLNAFINQQQADERLKRNMIRKFGADLIMVCGNWSASMVANHAPIRGRGWRTKFKKFGFPTYLFDEYRTSKICPNCDGELEKFKWIRNPRPYQRQRTPRVLCHGLLQCQICRYERTNGDNETISEPCVFNRDMAAVLNFRRIVKYYIEHGNVPEVFWRNEHRRAAAEAAEAAAALAAAPIAAYIPIVATTTTTARGAARAARATRARGTAASPAPASTFLMMLRSTRRSNSTSGTLPPAKLPFPSLRRLDCRGDYPFGDDLVLFRGNAATLEVLRLTLTRELAAALLWHNVFTPTSHPKLQIVMLKPPPGMAQANHVDDSEIIQLMLDIAPGAAVRGISNWYLDQAPPPVLSLLNRHASIQVLALPALRLSLWDAMTLIQSLPLLSDLHAQAPTLDPMPAGVTKRILVNYVCSNYSPTGKRFRCWHFGCVNVKCLKDTVNPFLLLALACPNFDYAAIVHYNRETFAKLLEKAIDTIAFKKHAPRLHRLLPYVLDKC
ncbi:hypothetical protein H4S04_003329 [Coemansia sp. S16]|nr:hypothetical protein H4S04_003329 [Coemansia sp. S16]